VKVSCRDISKIALSSYRATYLVSICQALPSLDESFSHNILILCSRVTIIIQGIRYILVHVNDECSEFWPHELIKQLLYARLTVVVSELLSDIVKWRTLSVERNFGIRPDNDVTVLLTESYSLSV
jgi:hypothetical protein